MPVQQPGDLASCAVCERTILPGEQISEYVAPDGERVGVCALCKPRAEASGWIPAEQAGRLARDPAPRRRRGFNLRQRLRVASEGLSRVSGAAAGRDRGEDAEEATPAPSREERPATQRSQRAPEGTESPEASGSPAAQARTTPAEPLTRERLLRLAVDAFNAGPGPRKVAGLLRSLGEPQVAVRAEGSAQALVTVAWELSWYQWNVDLDGGADVREVRKGNELSELESGEQVWNASVLDDGRLRLGVAAAQSSGGAES